MKKGNTVKAIMQKLGQEKLIEGVIQYVSQYRKVSPVDIGIFKTKIKDLFRKFESEQEVTPKHLVLLSYFSTKEDLGFFDYYNRLAIFYEDDILLFRPNPVWDAAIGTEDRWLLRDFYELQDVDVILLCKLSCFPKPLVWDWNRWEEILEATVMGTACTDDALEYETVIELTGKYMEFLLGNIEINSELKTYPLFLKPERLSIDDMNSEAKMYLLRDRLQNELALYGEVRYAFRHLIEEN